MSKVIVLSLISGGSMTNDGMWCCSREEVVRYYDDCPSPLIAIVPVLRILSR